MTYPVFASGDVLNASDMNAVGLWLVTSGTFTTATSVSLPASTFSSTYRNYRILLDITAITADSTFTMRMRASGTDTATGYDYSIPGLGSGNNISNQNGFNTTSWAVGFGDAGLPQYAIIMDLIAPNIAGPTSVFYTNGAYSLDSSEFYSRTGQGRQRSSTQFDSLSFISSVASSITGAYRVYGYRD